MNGKLRNGIIKYSVSVVSAGSVTVYMLASRGYGEVTVAAEKYRLLCDAFSVPGVLMILIGALIWLDNLGANDGVLFYFFSRVKNFFFPVQERKKETYLQYVQRRREREKTKGFSFLFIVGGVFCAVATVFLVLFNKTYC